MDAPHFSLTDRSGLIALEGFSESLAKELDPSWNIKVGSFVPMFRLTHL